MALRAFGAPESNNLMPLLRAHWFTPGLQVTATHLGPPDAGT